MCLGSSAKAQPLPPVAPAAPTMADPAVAEARKAAATPLPSEGLAGTQLTVNLGGQGAGKKKLAGV